MYQANKRDQWRHLQLIESHWLQKSRKTTKIIKCLYKPFFRLLNLSLWSVHSRLTIMVSANIIWAVLILSMLMMLIESETVTGRSGFAGSVGGFCKYVSGTITWEKFSKKKKDVAVSFFPKRQTMNGATRNDRSDHLPNENRTNLCDPLKSPISIKTTYPIQDYSPRNVLGHYKAMNYR